MDADDTLPMSEALPEAAPPAAGGCAHIYDQSRAACPHPVPAEAECCLWHNPAVSKGDAYVARLVAAAAASSAGDLVEARLVALIAPGIQLAGADLSRADLRDAELDGADLTGAVLAGANLRRASLRRARLGGVDLSGADLAGTNFAGADLHGARLGGARLDATVLNAADLTGADLTGAEIRSFHWNHRTRLDGVTGLERPGGIDDETRPHPAIGSGSLADPDPEDDLTREFRPSADSAKRPATVAASDLLAPEGPNLPPVPAPSRRGPWMAVAVVAAVLAVAGTSLGVWGLRTAAAMPRDAAIAASERDAALRQAEANLAEVRTLQARAAELDAAASSARSDAQRAKDEAAVRRAEAEDARRRLVAAESDLVRLRDADDRSALMALRLAEAKRLAREQATEMAKQERVGGILAEGVRHLREENDRLSKAVNERIAEERRVDLLTVESSRLKQENEGLKADRDALAVRERRLTGDLAESRRAIDAYLTRVAEADLGAVLGDDAAKLPLLTVKAGSPIALGGGDYMVSLRLDAVAGGVTAKLVVQRPAGLANPDIGVILYDAHEKPLRRLGFGFPHVDAGAPFASASATVACETFPAFARVIVSPAASAPVGAR
jgi:uncharacterized protein YjbI with pentapeptide repeats